MRNHLPLNALRAFEAAARHTSFSRAAEELCVTPTAISHQIRTLEDLLDVPLFARRNGRLELTAAATAALADLSAGFDKLETAMRPLSRKGDGQRLVVAASPSVASLWLLPRLHRFMTAVPDVGITLATVVDPARFADADFDIAIGHVPEGAGRTVEFLMEERILPVCASHLMPEAGGGKRAALATLPLIHDDKPGGRFPTWQTYLTRSGLQRRDVASGLRFNQSSLATEAALAGYGVLLGRSRLVAPALKAGRLVAIDDDLCFTQTYVTLRASGAAPARVRLFLDWLAAEVRTEDREAAIAAAGKATGPQTRHRTAEPACV